MTEKEIVEAANTEIRQYAEGRRKDVARGAETPELAALLVQKYGYGVLKGVRIALGRAISHDVLDEEVAKIDPDWREHMHQRWAARPAEVDKKTLEN
ncbi:hypothetical protein [Acidicapsa ligni]|uniref:hypothetical protein n=1 Tax=Acidicapsa ligni TaxID=542300 RepID=UPI0021DF5F3D|nr:hypothetical protein [Acidicapsa ligni]